jgi:hypothetical protein
MLGHSGARAKARAPGIQVNAASLAEADFIL